MARIDRLPPPPANPVRSPAVVVAGEELITVHETPLTPPLEARIRVPVGATRAVVICHPHPLYGGSMHSPIPLAVAKTLADKGEKTTAFIRFNYRGVGESRGVYGDGQGERDDVLAAIAEIRRRAPSLPVHVVGHSFGSWVGLRAAEADGEIKSVLLVAPSSRFFTFGQSEGPRKQRDIGRLGLYIGDQDEFCDVDEARGLAESLGADFRVFEGFDHHFMKSRRVLAEAAFEWVTA